MIRTYRTAALLAATLLSIGTFTAAQAQKPTGLPDNYPSKPVRIIISSSPGGAIDICGRLVQGKLAERWGGGVIAENRTGNGVAFDFVSKAAPDGYTLLTTGISAFVGAELTLNLPYSLRTKFPPISQCITTPYIVSVNNELPVKNIKELVAYAKANPNKLNYAYNSTGSTSHLFGELFKYVANLDIQGIPFKGVGPSYFEQMAGRINITTGTAASAGPLAKAGKIRPVAVTSAKRMKTLPDIPTMTEVLPTFDVMEGWVGFLGIEGMNPAIIAALNREMNAVLASPESERTLTSDGSEIPLSTPAQFRKVIADSGDSTARIVKQAGIKLE